MPKGDEQAFPAPGGLICDYFGNPQGYQPPTPGMTRRQWLVGMAMQGMWATSAPMGGQNGESSTKFYARLANKQADEILALE